MFAFLCFAVHYSLGQSNTLFGSMRRMNGNIHFQFQGKASLFREESTPERNALILRGDERTLRIIMSPTVFEGENRMILRKPDFFLEMHPWIRINRCLPEKGNRFAPWTETFTTSQRASSTIPWLSFSRSLQSER